MIQPVDPMAMGAISPSFTVKWVPWTDAVLGGISCLWISPSLNPWIVVLAEALQAERADSYPEEVFL